MLQRLAKSSVARAYGSVVGRLCGGKASINSSGCPPVLGIKRETINPWEQRTPLIPNHVERLVKEGIRVLIQPSNRRCFCADEFEAVGAHISEDLSPASLILGVKRPTDLGPKDILPNKTYAFFTHTIKAQPENMPLLDALLERVSSCPFTHRMQLTKMAS
ncbi:unnamed protein product [Dicrocoelium dendriticum]|nr:unnamed protein product [Dicrocoelium dendriticum]